MPATSIENETNVLVAPQDLSTLRVAVWQQGGSPEDATINLQQAIVCSPGVFTITDGASVDINPANGGIQVWMLGANRTPTASSFAAGQSILMHIGRSGSYSVNWTAVGVVWGGGSGPVIPASGYAVVVLYKVGSTIYGHVSEDVA